MLEIGKLKPERMNIGFKTKKFDANACCCVVHNVEMSNPIDNVLSRNRQVPPNSRNGLPTNGTLNQSMPTAATSDTSISPIAKNGKVLPMAPKWQWNVGARFEQRWQQSSVNWFAQANVNGVSGQYLDALLDPRSWQESYALFNASIGVEPDSGKWRLSVWGKNIGDKKYFVAAAAQTQAANVSAGGTKAINGYVGWPGIPRTFGIEASYWL